MDKWDFLITNNTDEDLTAFENLAKKAFLTTLEAEGIVANGEISILFINDEEMQQINKTHRGKDAPTDVLSFPQYDQIEDGEDAFLMLGDIVVSMDTAKKQATELNHSLEREVAFLIVHGTLHLLGYDHETQEEEDEMTALQEEILTKIDLGVN
ncbi:MAG: rRNA maturation RNase YbeY [Defluviitaleaceae bacterium]|nr:rRNA maturation RNase YbeY [Defluviitaleaceae bacterium]